MAAGMKSGGSVGWNPWHGCTKISPGCRYCYVYRQDAMFGVETSSSRARRTGEFDLPLRRSRDGSWKIRPGSLVYTCFTSDFLLQDADAWRPAAWEMMRRRSDCRFLFFTKRIDRLLDTLPADWGEGYGNVTVGCTVENQAMADYRLPLFRELPIRHKAVIAAPLLERLDLTPWLGDWVEELSAGGESGAQARLCDYDWVLDLRRQCVERGVPFRFHQTGARLLKEGRIYRIRRCFQIAQARKAAIDYLIGPDGEPLRKNAESDSIQIYTNGEPKP